MTAPLFRLSAGSLETVSTGVTVVVDGSEGHHAVRVRRIGVGEPVRLADGSTLLADGTVTAADDGRLCVMVNRVSELPTPSPRFVLVQALAKHGRDELAVEAATEVGADAVIPWQAERSVVVWRGERGRRSATKWATIADAAAKQARRPVVPTIEELVDTRALVERVAGSALGLVLHEEADASLAGTALPDDGDVLVMVGPEGGIAPGELAALVAAGARPVRLGETVLRSSTAGPVALGILSAQARWR